MNTKRNSHSYNHLNLPTKIDFGDGEYIQYTYNASGIKLKKLVREKNDSGTLTESRTEYLAGYQYNNAVLQFFPHAEGYIQHKKDGDEHFYNYVYQYKDHLGNIRLNYSYDEGNQELKIMNEHHYYSFGLEHKYYNNARRDFIVKTKIADQGGGKYVKIEMVANSGYMYKYNGKELQDELGLNMYAMDMRQYDPAIARWVVQDPVIQHSKSPYNAFDNNPVYWADPSGAYHQNIVNGRLDTSKWSNFGFGTNSSSSDNTSVSQDGGGGTNSTWSHLEGSFYINNTTGAVSNNWEMAVNSTFSILGGTMNSGFYGSDCAGCTNLDVVTITGHAKRGFSNAAMQAAADNVAGQVNAGVKDYLNRTNLSYTGVATYGSWKYMGGRYVQTNGKIGNFLETVSKNAKLSSMKASAFKNAGIVGNVITAGMIGYDIYQDGQIQTSNIINGSLVIVSTAALIAATMIATPAVIFGSAVVGTAIFVYGVADFIFDIGGGLDRKYGQFKVY